MKRRDFLQTAGLLTAGATDVLAACRTSEAMGSEVRGRRSPAEAAIMQVLVTSAMSTGSTIEPAAPTTCSRRP